MNYLLSPQSIDPGLLLLHNMDNTHARTHARTHISGVDELLGKLQGVAERSPASLPRLTSSPR